MRGLVLMLVAVIGLAAAAPARVAAQEATPSAGPGGVITRTDARYFLPFTGDGLNPALSEAGNDSGVCSFSSLANIGRPDAWVCIGAEGGQVYDPCFENPFAPMDDPGALACVASPFETEVVLFTPTEPLHREKEVAPEVPIDSSQQAPPQAPPMGAVADAKESAGDPAGGQAYPGPVDTGDRKRDQPSLGPGPAEPAQIAEVAIDPLDIPWALELANGETCTLLTGSTAVLAGQRVNYACEGGEVIGEVDRSQPVWTVDYLATDAIATSRVDVTVAWT